MNIGIPKERKKYEKRVSLSPGGVYALVKSGHKVFIETEAGLGSGFSDDDYARVGGTIVFSAEEVYQRSELIAKFTSITSDDVELLTDGQIVLGFLHLAVESSSVINTMLKKKITAIAYETIQQEDGTLPVLVPMSEIAGRLLIHIASQYLSSMYGGMGILLSGVPGVPSAEIVILGAGTVGTSAAKFFSSIGAQVTVMDINFSKLQKLDNQVHYRINTMVATNYNIEKSVRYADVLIGAILVPGARTPQIVTREMVKSMKPKSLIIDVSIDQGGCIDTSRPTTLGDPTFVEEGIIHYCVPNITGMVARTSTHVITNITTPYILNIANKGIEKAIDEDKSLSRGVNLRNGDIVNPNIK